MYNDFLKNKFLNTTKTSYIINNNLLYSYATCVGIIKGCDLITTNKKYSATTSKQITQACRKLYLIKKVIKYDKFIELLKNYNMEV